MITKYKETKKRSWQNIFFAVLLGSTILVIVGFLVVSNFKIIKKRSELSSQIDKLEEQIGALKEKKQQLQAQIYQSTEEEYLEKEARERFNLKKPGEEVVTILPPEEGEPEEQPQGFWETLFNW